MENPDIPPEGTFARFAYFSRSDIDRAAAKRVMDGFERALSEAGAGALNRNVIFVEVFERLFYLLLAENGREDTLRGLEGFARNQRAAIAAGTILPTRLH